MSKITIWTDGSSKGNPGRGGAAAIVTMETKNGLAQKHFTTHMENATNNQMELRAVIIGLQALKGPKHDVTIMTDSAYVADNVMGGHVKQWAQNGWVTKAKKPCANVNDWQELHDVMHEKCCSFTIVKVAGHSGSEFNELADQLAKKAADETF